LVKAKNLLNSPKSNYCPLEKEFSAQFQVLDLQNLSSHAEIIYPRSIGCVFEEDLRHSVHLGVAACGWHAQANVKDVLE
jgi:hypothetical protein